MMQDFLVAQQRREEGLLAEIRGLRASLPSADRLPQPAVIPRSRAAQPPPVQNQPFATTTPSTVTASSPRLDLPTPAPRHKSVPQPISHPQYHGKPNHLIQFTCSKSLRGNYRSSSGTMVWLTVSRHPHTDLGPQGPLPLCWLSLPPAALFHSSVTRVQEREENVGKRRESSNSPGASTCAQNQPGHNILIMSAFTCARAREKLR
ncbi:hypothetical protein PAMP_001052 [Pampus punctatissimus]